MTALPFADDAILDALLTEIASLLRRLVDHGEAGSIDLLGLPLSPSCITALEDRLGRGQLTIRLDAAGRSDIHETSFPGVWWVLHANESGRTIALLIEVAIVPKIVEADIEDVANALLRLPGCTNYARHTPRSAA
jgi:hydrogenase-1 operon protein HyaF